MLKMVSIGSSICGTSLESFKRRLCKWFWCLFVCIWVLLLHHITHSFLNYPTFPTGRVILIFFKVKFSSGLNLFLGVNMVFVPYFVSGVAYRRRILSIYGKHRLGWWDCQWCIGIGCDSVYQQKLLQCLVRRGIWCFFECCLQNVQPGCLILADIAVWLCALFGRFRRTPWIRLLWIGFRCR